ncbi:MAG: PAS domain S-box protein [bacterium]
MKLQTKIALLILILALIIGLISSYLVGRLMMGNHEVELEEKGIAIAQTVSELITIHVINRDKLSAQAALKSIVERTEDVDFAYLIGFNGNIFSHSFDGGFPEALVQKLLGADQKSGSQEVDEMARAFKQMMKDRTAMDEKINLAERRYKIMFEQAPDAIVTIDPETELPIDFNDQLLHLLGYSREEFCNIRISDYEAVETPDEIRKHINKILKKGSDQFATRMRTKTGRIIDVLINSQVIELSGKRVFHDILRDITERKMAEEKAASLGRILERSLNEIYIFDEETLKFIQVNRGARENLGYSMEELREMTPLDLKPEYTPDKFADLVEPLRTGKQNMIQFTTLQLRKDKSVYPVEVYLHLSTLEFHPVFVAIILDITERKKLETQLLQAQKMEAIGTLAGGIAHDFNNILSAIIGYSELALRDLPDDHAVRENLQIILDGGEKAAALTRHLLAFSRKQVLDIKVINLNHIIRNTAKMLARLIGENVSIELHLQPSLKNVKADLVQIEQILMNLAVNARDAMPAGGRLIIETMNIENDAEHVRGSGGMKAGSYVMMAVTDTGEGMSREVMDHIFDPFFTTKEAGKGTGLGLSMVYGIVMQHNGHIDVVYSEPGHGTTFKVCLPAAEGKEEGKEVAEVPKELSGTETILVVEDEASIRSLIVDILDPLGYRILVASNGSEALRISDSFEKGIDLLLTDVIMPGVSGKELAETFKSKRPGTKVMFMSGYTDSVLAHYGAEEQEISFMQKPLTPSKLAREVRRILDKGLITT